MNLLKICTNFCPPFTTATGNDVDEGETSRNTPRENAQNEWTPLLPTEQMRYPQGSGIRNWLLRLFPDKGAARANTEQMRYNHNLIRNIIPVWMDAQDRSDAPNSTYDLLARTFIEENKLSTRQTPLDASDEKLKDFCKKHADFLQLIGEEYAKQHGNPPKPEHLHFLLELSMLKSGEDPYLSIDRDTMQKMISDATELLTCFDGLKEEKGAALSAADVKTFHGLTQARPGELPFGLSEDEAIITANDIANDFVPYALALSRYASLPGAPRHEKNGTDEQVVFEPDFQKFMAAAHAECARQEGWRPYFQGYLVSCIRDKKFELETRSAFLALKGVFPDKATVEKLVPHVKSQHFHIKNTPAQRGHESLFAYHAAILAIIHQTNKGPYKVFASCDSANKISVLKFVLAREYEAELRNDLDAWCQAYREDKALYQSFLDNLPIAITEKFDRALPQNLLTSKPTVPEFHVERFASRYLRLLKEQPDYGIATAIAEYCDETAFWTTTPPPSTSEADRQILDRLHQAWAENAPDERFTREALAALRIERDNHEYRKKSDDSEPDQVDVEAFFNDYIAVRIHDLRGRPA